MDANDSRMEVQKKIEITLGIIIALSVIAIVIVLIVKQLNRKSYINLTVAPSSAQIIIDGQQYRNGSYRVEPGEYQITLSAEGFIGKTLDVEVGSGKTSTIQEFLLPEGETIKYYENYPDEVKILRNMVENEEAQEFASEFDRKYSIEDILPIKYADYSSDYVDFRIVRGDEICERWFCLVIRDAFGNGEDAAMQKIIDSGYEPSDYEIHYLDLSGSVTI